MRSRSALAARAWVLAKQLELRDTLGTAAHPVWSITESEVAPTFPWAEQTLCPTKEGD